MTDEAKLNHIYKTLMSAVRSKRITTAEYGQVLDVIHARRHDPPTIEQQNAADRVWRRATADP